MEAFPAFRWRPDLMGGRGEPVQNRVVVDARAKVNLFLRVLGRRDDGYHDLESLIVPIDLADRLEIDAVSDRTQFRTLSLSLEVTGDERLVRGVPVDETNLVLKAASALAERAEVPGFAYIRLEKRIPSAAGLGGGSADAAATLRVLNDLWSCGLGDEEMRLIAEGVGSDVPALLAGGAVIARGRGERVEPVEVRGFRWAIAPAGFGVSTADAYGWWDQDEMAPGPDPRPIIDAARAGDVRALAGAMFNDLEEPVFRRHPELLEMKERLLLAGAAGVLMCGSGPTLAGLLSPDQEFDFDGATKVTSSAKRQPSLANDRF